MQQNYMRKLIVSLSAILAENITNLWGILFFFSFIDHSILLKPDT